MERSTNENLEGKDRRTSVLPNGDTLCHRWLSPVPSGEKTGSGKHHRNKAMTSAEIEFLHALMHSVALRTPPRSTPNPPTLLPSQVWRAAYCGGGRNNLIPFARFSQDPRGGFLSPASRVISAASEASFAVFFPKTWPLVVPVSGQTHPNATVPAMFKRTAANRISTNR
jgi:hypothetical protein